MKFGSVDLPLIQKSMRTDNAEMLAEQEGALDNQIVDFRKDPDAWKKKNAQDFGCAEDEEEEGHQGDEEEDGSVGSAGAPKEEGCNLCVVVVIAAAVVVVLAVVLLLACLCCRQAQ